MEYLMDLLYLLFLTLKSVVKKNLALSGKHFDTHEQKLAKMQSLQNELNNLSVEQLQQIYQYL